MQFNKSYRLLRYLNRSHSRVSRYGLGALAWLGTLAFTRSATLAGLMPAWSERMSEHYGT